MGKAWVQRDMAVHVLQFFSTLDNGGAENRMMDVYRCIRSDVVMFDFAVLHEGRHIFDEEVLQNGSQKYVLPDPRKGLLKNYIALVRFFRQHEFQAVHAHVAWYGGVVLMAAKQAGIKIRIAHARDSAMPNRHWKESLLCRIGQVLIALSATQRIAISQEAAQNIFGKRACRQKKYLFVPNAIDQKKYAVLSGADRARLREKLGIAPDTKAYVTVANLRRQKNHLFLMEIVREMKARDHRFVLYLIGEGDQRDPIAQKIREYGLEEHVVFMGNRNDVPQILCAFDGMLFPSLFEGLGGVVLEAQLVGVPVVASKAIPDVADVGMNMVRRLSLEEGPGVWADTALEHFAHAEWDHQSALQHFEQKGYCIEYTARRYLQAYGLSEADIEKAIR